MAEYKHLAKMTFRKKGTATPSGTTAAGLPPLPQQQTSEKYLLAKNTHDQIQMKTFTRWWNAELPQEHRITDLVSGVASGIACCALIEQLTMDPFPPRARMGALIDMANRTGDAYNMDAAHSRIKAIENQNIFLNRVRSLGIDLVNISEEDLVDGRQTLILGLTWKLITHFSDGMLSDANGAELLSWINQNTSPFDVRISSWADLSDGVALCTLLHAYDPGCLSLESTHGKVSQATAMANVERALAAAEAFGAPRLVDAADVVQTTGAESVDVRSLQTYTLKLRQALRQHALSSRTEAAEALLRLLGRADALVAWTASESAAWEGHAGEVHTAAAGSAASPAERTALISKAEAIDEAFEAFVKGPKAAKAEERAAIFREASPLLELLEAPQQPGTAAHTFDHGAPLNEINIALPEGATASGADAARRFREGVSQVDTAWKALEGAESACSAAVFSVLAHKKTDRMLADAELEVTALSSWAQERTQNLHDALIDPQGGDSLRAVSQATKVLAAWAEGASSSMADRETKLRATLAEVGQRRQAEDRAPIEAQGVQALDGDWEAMRAAATELRRSVGAALKAQAEHIADATTTWETMSPALNATLPADDHLVGPPKMAEAGGCAVM